MEKLLITHFPIPPRQPPKFIHPSLRVQYNFRPFQRLPLELRLKIWQLSFPGPRKVRLDLSVLGSPPPTRLPVIMFVNHESRVETLKHYTVIFPTDIFEFPSGPVTPPFCFNPSTDSLYFRAEACDWESMREAFPKWLDYLGSRLPGGMISISHVCMLWDRYHAPRSFNGTDWVGHIGDLLLKFNGLQRLSVERVYPTTREMLEQSLRLFLLENKESFVSRTPPKVTLSNIEN